MNLPSCRSAALAALVALLGAAPAPVRPTAPAAAASGGPSAPVASGSPFPSAPPSAELRGGATAPPQAVSPSPGVPPVATNTTDVTRATLPNGLRVVIVRDPLAPVVSVYENYLVGADDTPAGFPGTAHAQEHMAFRGCSGVSADQTAAIFAQLGGDGNADTQQTVTQYFDTVPAADLDVALHLDSDCMRKIDDDQSQWASERGAIEQEVSRDLSSPTYRAFTRITADVFAGTPYAHDALGTRPSFDRTTGALLQRFDRSWYAPNNAVLVIAGDVDAQAALATVRSLYGSIPSHAVPVHPAVALRPVKPETFTLSSDLPYALALVAYRLPGSSDPDYAATRILGDVLASQRANLYALGVAGKALQAGFEFQSNLPKASIGLALGVLPAGSDVKAFDATLASVVAGYVRDGVPPDLVDAAKRSEIASAEYDRNSVDDLAATWSQALAVDGRTSPDDDVEAVRAVTVADVNRVAKQYLDPKAAIVANLVPQTSGKAVSAKGFGGGEVTTAQPTQPVTLPAWARAKLARLDVPGSTLAPVDTRLPSGLRLIVQPETASDTVTVVGEIEHQDALQSPRGKEGVDAVLSQLFSYGTSTLPRLDFQKALDDIAAQETAGTSFSLHVLKANFERGVELLADNELHPALPPSDFEIVRRQSQAATAGEEQSPSYLAQRAIAKAVLPAGDPDLRVPTPASIGNVSLPDVAAYHARVYRPDATTIVVIGNVTPADAQATIAKYFGGWTATGAKPRLTLPALPPNRPSAAVVPDASRLQDATTLVESVQLTRTNPDYYALELGDHVLGGGFYATRLYHDLRQVTGLVYTVSNQLSAGKTRSTYSLDFDSDPKNVSQARRLIGRDLRAMQTKPVGGAELRQAKAILLRQLPLAESSEDAVAGDLAGNALAGLPLDERHRAAEIYAQLDAAHVRSAFAKYIRPDGFVQVVEGPTPR